MIILRYSAKRLTQPMYNKTILRFMQDWPEIKAPNISLPLKIEDRHLPQVPHTPVSYPPGVEGPLKESRALVDMRGPERIHNQLIYKQFGLIAIGGGSMQGCHFDMIRDRVNKYIDFERFFAIWRVDPPMKSVTRKGLGKRGGGGKAKVHHFETPIKAGRIIFEVAGLGTYGEVSRVIENVSNKLPFYTMPISQEKMDKLYEEKKFLDSINYNPFEYRDILRRDFSGSRSRMSPYEVEWGGTYF